MNKTIYALGFFDGVHVGHAALLDRCKTLARKENYRAGVVTFAAHPDTLVLGNTPPKSSMICRAAFCRFLARL